MTVRRRLGLIIAAILTVLSLTSCMELGAVDSTDELKDYFSGVILLSPSGKTERSITDLTDLDAEDSDRYIPVVVDYENYAYVCFKAKKNITVDEFVLYARCEEDGGTLDLEFYVTNEIPTKILVGDKQVYFPDSYGNMPSKDSSGEYVDREDEVSEDDVFSDRVSFLDHSFGVSDDWRSVHFEFDSPRTVQSGHYVVIRIRNNLTGTDGAVKFTLNYPLFHFEEAG